VSLVFLVVDLLLCDLEVARNLKPIAALRRPRISQEVHAG